MPVYPDFVVVSMKHIFDRAAQRDIFYAKIEAIGPIC
jgi:hypothetical protein